MRKLQLTVLFAALVLFGIVTSWDDASATRPTDEPVQAQGMMETSTERIIKPGDDLQEALDSMNDGGRLIFSEGTYPIDSSIVIKDKKRISIEGRGRVSIVGSRVDFPILKIEGCTEVNLKNIHAVHERNIPAGDGQFEKTEGSVVYLKSCGNVSFDGCELEGCGVYGIYAVDTDTVDVNGCYLHHNSWRAIGIFNEHAKTLLNIKNTNITQNTGFIEASEDSCTLNLGEGNFLSDNTPEAYQNSR